MIWHMADSLSVERDILTAAAASAVHWGISTTTLLKTSQAETHLQGPITKFSFHKVISKCYDTMISRGAYIILLNYSNAHVT